MKILFLLPCSLLLAISLFAQFEGIHLQSGTHITSNKLFYAKEASGAPGGNSSIQEEIKSDWGFATSGLVTWKLSNKASLLSGLTYERSIYTYQANNIILPEDIIQGTVTTFIQEIKVQRLGIPLQLHYRLSPIFTGILGFSVERVFYNKRKPALTGAGAIDGAFENFGDVRFNDFSYWSTLGLDISIRSNDQNRLSFQPLFSVALQSEDIYRVDQRDIHLYRLSSLVAFLHQL